MRRSRTVFHFVTSPLMAVLLGACAAPEQLPSSTEAAPHTDRQQDRERLPASQTGTAIVGKFEVLKKGKEATLTWLKAEQLSALVLPEGESRYLTLGVDAQGWFSWPLGPGTYALRAVRYGQGSRTRILPIGGRFAVADGQTLYIGHIVVDVEENKLGFRDKEQEAIQQAGKGSAVAGWAKQLLAAEERTGTYSRIRSICAKDWGLQCTRSVQGVEPIAPAITQGLSSLSFTRVATVRPELRWKAPSGTDISFDVAIWQAAAYRAPGKLADDYLPGQLVVYEQDLRTPELNLKSDLKPRTKYYWSVRLRKDDTISTWSHAGHFTFLVVAWSASSGGWFGFETPP